MPIPTSPSTTPSNRVRCSAICLLRISASPSAKSALNIQDLSTPDCGKRSPRQGDSGHSSQRLRRKNLLGAMISRERLDHAAMRSDDRALFHNFIKQQSRNIGTRIPPDGPRVATKVRELQPWQRFLMTTTFTSLAPASPLLRDS